MKTTKKYMHFLFFIFLSFFFRQGLLAQDCVERDRAALIAIYNALDGPNWIEKTNWLTDAPLGDWYGVTTDENGCVSGLDLDGNLVENQIGAGNGLNGVLPNSLWELKDLESLAISESTNGTLRGTIDEQLLQLTNLKKLLISGGGDRLITGSIPNDIGQLKKLENIFLANNSITGAIPTSIGDLENLQSISLYNNQLSGNLPIEISKLKNLYWLNIYGNSFTGNIPPEYGQLEKLWLLSLGSNYLTGEIPVELSNLKELRILNLDNNNLSRNIPLELGQLSLLVSLFLNDNQLSGSIPASFGALKNMERLNLSNNDLSGCFPESLKNLCYLTTDLLNDFNCQWNNNELIGCQFDFRNNPQLPNGGDFDAFCSASQGSCGETTCLDFSAQLSITGTPTYCAGDATQLSANRDYTAYCWSNGSLEKSIVTSQAGTYGLTVTDATNGCIGITSITIEEIQISSSCDDDNPETENDVIQADCSCQGTRVENDCVANNRAALVELYNATGGDNWTNKTNWLSDAPLGEWFGVMTNEDGCVTELRLLDNNLNGILPASIENLSQLAFLNLSSNNLSGTIPENIGNLNQLTSLFLGDNNLSGTIPTSISNLNQLKSLFLGNNSLSGTIPAAIGNLSQLVYLSLLENNISGTIPTSIGNLNQLTSLNLRENNLSGTIPTSISNLNQLTHLDLSNNNLSGPIPAAIGNFSLLTRLRLNNNNLSGCFPETFSTLCYLTSTDFENCAPVLTCQYGFSNNSGLPWGGDFDEFCLQGYEAQFNVPCDDNNPNTTNDRINQDCECQGDLCEIPIADAGLEKIITCIDSIAFIGGTNSSDGAGFAYAWTTTNGLIVSGASTPNARVSQAGTYYLEVRTIVGGCSTIDSVVVMADNTSPTINIDSPPTLNCEVVQVSINATNSSEGSHQWQTEDGQIINGETTLNPTVDQPGNYVLTITGANSCIATEEVVVTIDTTPPIARINPAELLTCSNPTLNLDASVSERANSYQWSSLGGSTITNSNSPTPIISEPDTYLVEVKAVNGCKHTEAITIAEDKAQPRVNIDSAATLNCNNPTLQLSVIDEELVEQYQWTTIGGNITSATNTPMPTIDRAGIYELMVTAANGCINTASVSVDGDFEPPIANAGLENQVIPCNISTLILDGMASENGDTYHWRSNNGQFNSANLTQARIEVSTEGDYTLVVTASNGCKDSTTVFVNEASQPRDVRLEIEAVSCHNEKDGSIRLMEVEGGTPPFRYAILPDSFQMENEFNNLSSNTYFPMVKDANDCLLEIEAIALNNPEALYIAINQGESLGVCTGKKTSLTAQVEGAIGTPFFDWTGDNIEYQEDNFEQSTIQIAPFISSPYFVEATDEKGCTIRDTLLVEVLKFEERPLILTPEGSNQYDKLSIPCLEEEIDVLDELYPDREIIIVNRWGNTVYQVKPYNNDWDGRNLNGQMLPHGTYYYILRLNMGEGEILYGDILLMR